MAVQKDGLVLITGSTGFVGFRTLVEAVKAGYNVRATVRRAEQALLIKHRAEVAPYASRLQIVVIPDLKAAGAFDTVMNGVTHVLHIASPVPSPTDDPEAGLIRPAVDATTQIVEAAKKTPTLERLVVTSSILAIQYETLLGRALEATFDETYRVRPLPTGPWKGQQLIPVYAAGKALALDIMDQLAASKPPFDVISILPSVVVGPNPLYKSADEMLAGGASNALMLRMAAGNRDTNPFPMGVVGLSDVARIHVAALDPAVVAGSDTFVLDAGRPSYDEFKDVIARHFPEAVKDGTFSMDGTWSSFQVRTDVSHTVKTFGALDSYESDAVALAKQYLDLRAKESN